jgi:hypothetical protein
MKKILFFIPLLFLAIFFINSFKVKTTQAQEVACTADAKQCPDGSFVSRTGPNCEFEACPEIPSTCPTDSTGKVMCPQYSLIPNFCYGGQIVPGETDECGCQGAPTCIEASPIPSPSPPTGCFYQEVQCIQAPCDPVLVCPSPTPTPTTTVFKNCSSTADCSSNEICYQPPMPVCPQGAFCAQVMPAKYCKEADTPVNNKVSFATPYVQLSADNFYIDINGTKFTSKDANVSVHSDPGSDNYTTLELTWNESNVPMRMYIYFSYSPGDFWKVTELRTYNGDTNGNWLYYDGFTGNEHGRSLIMSVFDLTSKDGSGKVHFENLNLQPFLPTDHKPPSQYGYYIEKKPIEDIEVFLSGPYHGYGVNAVLRNNQDQIVTDQSQFTYFWTTSNPAVVTVSPNSTYIGPTNNPTGCSFGVSFPCPMSNAQMSFHGIGTAKVNVRVLNSTQQEVASEEFTFTVKPKSADLNNDGKVNISDFTILNSQFMRTDYPTGDINADGKVNIKDFTIMISEFSVI